MPSRARSRAYEILEKASPGDGASRAFDLSIVTLIVLNVAMVVVETVRDLSVRYGGFFDAFELFSVLVFTVEYLLRLWSCTADPRFRQPFWGRIRFALTPMALVDLLAIAPFYLPMVTGVDLRVIRSVRLVRLFRLFKMGRYVVSLRILGAVLREKKEELNIVVFALIIVLVIVSSLMYFVEHEAQPEAFSSIPAAMWWGMVTLTTVGYGDVYPITPLGKFFGILIAALGIGMFALPAGILSSGFVEAIQSRREGKGICPHCGRDIHDPPESGR